jgi:Notch-like protein
LSTCQKIENTNPPNYQCLCPDYLTGDRCQYTNTCQKQPCLNRGSCIPLGPQNSFLCLCSPGFGHYDCSICKKKKILIKRNFFISIDLGLSCDSNVCLNGGICDFNTTNIRCTCPAGFAGPRCEWSKKMEGFELIK